MKQLPKTQLEAERMLEVQLRLTQLFRKEDAAVKAVLDCLYDVGSANLIEKKVGLPPVRGVLKPIARFSKPLFRFVAFRWFVANCPELIVDWLYEKVSFEPVTEETEAVLETPLEPASELPSPPREIEASLEPPNALTQSALAKLEVQDLEIQKLYGRVRWLTGFSVGAIAMTAGLTVLVLGSNVLPDGLLSLPSTERSLVESPSLRD